MRKILLFLLCSMMTVSVMAQERKISGTITDKDTKEAVSQVTIQLLKSDSTYVNGTLTDDDGHFALTAPSDSKYILKITSVGYKTMTKNITLANGKDIDLGHFTMKADAIMLKGITATAQAAKVTVVEDTFVYNAAAYRTPEGSVAEELVRKLPGAEVSDDGTIKINGKTVKKVKVDGKEFMTGDTKTAMKNLPTSIIEKVKAYDEKSDMARITGIDDGEESTVLDFGLKEGMHKGAFGNADLGIGTKSRYSEKLMGSYMNSTTRLMAFGSANNTNDQGFPGGGGGRRFGGGSNGLNAAKMVGFNFNYEKKKKIEVDGSLLWNHTDGDRQSLSSSENFVSTVGSFTNSISQNFSRANSLMGQMKVEWKPDTLWNINFRANMNYSDNDGKTNSISASYNDDPYLYVDDPLSEEDIATLQANDLMVNRRMNLSASHNDNLSMDASLQINRKLGKKGRNVTVRGEVGFGDSESKNLTSTDVHLYQIQNYLNTGDSTYITNRYNLTPTKNWNYSLQATYSEPLKQNLFLQFSYRFQYRYNKSDRSTYDFSDLAYDMFDLYPGKYDGWGSYFSSLTSPLISYLDDDLSRFSEYKNYIHDMRVTLRWIKEKYRFNVGFMVQPQRSDFIQRYQGLNVDTTRNVVNLSPTIDFRYRFSNVSNLRLRYRGTTQQPSMSDLLDITDDSDPLNISKGNPGLKPSFTNSLELSYNGFRQYHMQSWGVFGNYSNTRNSISNMVTYNETTGGRITRPENINGNWNASLALMFNTSIDSVGVWNINTFTNLSHNNYVGYLYLNNYSGSVENTTKTSTIGERLQASFRKNLFELSVDGSLNYTHTRNLLQSQSNLDTWQFSYGGNLTFYTSWGMSIATDLHEQSRRGYNDASMNTNELIWNAQLSQSFLKGNALTVSLQFYDILQNMSNFSRTINSYQRNDVSYNTINSYAMLHVIYRINVFGTKESRKGMRGGGMGPRGDRPEGGFGGRGGFGGGGGNRPSRGGGFGGPR